MELRLLRYFVAVVDEGHIGRAAARLHMTQPPLSRAIRRLESDVGAPLLVRTPTGVRPTSVGALLHEEARGLLAHAEAVRERVSGTTVLTIGTLAGSVDADASRAAAAFREAYPGALVRIRESGLDDPSAGLRAGVVDVAISRVPFEADGITVRPLRADPVGVILLSADPLAARDDVALDDLAGRRWFRFPEGTDRLWTEYWTGRGSSGGSGASGPVVRTVQECLQAVLWSDSIGLGPAHGGSQDGLLPDGLTWVPVRDMPPSMLVVAWPAGSTNRLVEQFVEVAEAVYRR
jgi:DNA-binding transcriptional LysR family regulator